VPEHPRNGRIDRSAKPSPLRGKVDERDGAAGDLQIAAPMLSCCD
jgi:hypothetical protein